MSFYVAGTGSALPEKVVSNDDPRTISRYVRRVDRDAHGHPAAATSSRTSGWKISPSPRQRRRSPTRARAGRRSTSSSAPPCAATRHPRNGVRRRGSHRFCGARLRYQRRLRGRALLHGDRRFLHRRRQGQNGARRLLRGDEQAGRLTDRSTCVLFGDGAGAMVLRAGEGRLAGELSTRPDLHAIACPHRGEQPLQYDRAL